MNHRQSNYIIIGLLLLLVGLLMITYPSGADNKWYVCSTFTPHAIATMPPPTDTPARWILPMTVPPRNR